LNHNPSKTKRNSRKEHDRRSSGRSTRLSGKGRHPFQRRLQAMASNKGKVHDFER
jgi:hypothetical protein